MNQIMAMAIGGLAIMAAATAHGQGVVGSPPGEPQSSPLFTFGGLNVRVWAPVEPHYNVDANRNLAGEPLLRMNEPDRPVGFRTTRPGPGELSSFQSVAATARE
jgi:hypothetical protein